MNHPNAKKIKEKLFLLQLQTLSHFSNNPTLFISSDVPQHQKG